MRAKFQTGSVTRRTRRASFIGGPRALRGCADRPGDGCWITPSMIGAYEELHARGHAHSLEVWAGDEPNSNDE